MKTQTELIACVKRELNLRIVVYPKRVAERCMTQDQAEHEVQCMREILSIISEGHKSPQQELFNDTNATQP